ncbi:Fic family protein [Mesorhizobium sp. XAP10]|uniref:Fic family protein n=1 Tax=Mesorhizobium sp. XAP10 TaxID=3033800 RepID=UPI0023DEB983|nr:Fic family protein [Mesorhizobium sp. XAP10]MDF3153382.1 Fic family protein [Mesorhizobium sp. XAP10]
MHPFPDGNGRVSRLMSHAMALEAGIAAHGLWSISRGLARGVKSRTDYKRMMDHADMPARVISTDVATSPGAHSATLRYGSCRCASIR